MKNIKPGTAIRSTSALQNSHFEKAVIVITEYNEKGAMGFVINKIFPRRLNELEEFKNAAPFDLYSGGPVDTENLFVVHRRPGLIADSTHLYGNIFMGGNFKQVIQNINDGTISNEDIKLLIGYSGWDKGELEAEIEEGSWAIINDDNEHLIFSEEKMLWEKLVS